jgi:DNA repair protein RecO (recombination protein O)
MNESTVYLQPAFILKHKKYRETSLIIDVLTYDFGVVSILARGVRKKKSTLAGLLVPFTALKLSFVGKNDLKILTHAELNSLDFDLKGLALYCGFYINELVSSLLHKHDPHPELYQQYSSCLSSLNHSSKEIEVILRFFELDLIEYLGYGISLDYDAQSNATIKKAEKYIFSDGLGMVESSAGYISGGTLFALKERSRLSKQALYEAKQLMRQVISLHLQGKVLKSRLVLAKIIKQL